MDNKERKNIKRNYLIIVGICVIYLFFSGTQLASDQIAQGNKFGFINQLILIYACLIVAAILSIALHELGHLIFGLLTGYKFFYYRLFSTAIVKYYNGQVKIKKQYMPGTIGQCLLKPPAYKDGKYPFMLYNMGGLIINILLLIGFAIIARTTENIPLSVFSRSMVVSNLFLFLSNALPMLTNDGANILKLKKSQEFRTIFWHMLDQEYRQVNDLDLDFDKPIYKLEEKDFLTQYMDLGLVKEDIYDGKFDQALEGINKFYRDYDTLVPAYDVEALSERAFLQAYKDKDPSHFDILYTKDNARKISGVKKDPTRQRIFLYKTMLEKGDLAKVKKEFNQALSQNIDKYIVRREKELVSRLFEERGQDE